MGHRGRPSAWSEAKPRCGSPAGFHHAPWPVPTTPSFPALGKVADRRRSMPTALQRPSDSLFVRRRPHIEEGALSPHRHTALTDTGRPAWTVILKSSRGPAIRNHPGPGKLSGPSTFPRYEHPPKVGPPAGRKLLGSQGTLSQIWVLRAASVPAGVVDAMEFPGRKLKHLRPTPISSVDEPVGPAALRLFTDGGPL